MTKEIIVPVNYFTVFKNKLIPSDLAYEVYKDNQLKLENDTSLVFNVNPKRKQKWVRIFSDFFKIFNSENIEINVSNIDELTDNGALFLAEDLKCKNLKIESDGLINFRLDNWYYIDKEGEKRNNKLKSLKNITLKGRNLDVYLAAVKNIEQVYLKSEAGGDKFDWKGNDCWTAICFKHCDDLKRIDLSEVARFVGDHFAIDGLKDDCKIKFNSKSKIVSWWGNLTNHMLLHVLYYPEIGSEIKYPNLSYLDKSIELGEILDFNGEETKEFTFKEFKEQWTKYALEGPKKVKNKIKKRWARSR